jgi:serine/threonine protein kinase
MAEPDDIFCDALELASPAERAAYLDQACADDADLRRRVERLLEAHAASDSFLAGGPAIAAAAAPSLTEAPLTVLGPYKLLEQIGEGGFGIVFMAEQQQPIRRKVALKVLKPGMDTRQVVARFEAERHVLALMDHPNIARVLDGGETPGRRPYFVMELVKGVPITEYCDQNHLSVRARLELFSSVCHAVQHAHQKGIIHRDLKPTNVLVTLHDGVPVAKVIDFGIAKATGQRQTDKTLFTNFAQMLGTPLYMSPEQAEMSGLDIDTRSDIYALGVLLYELLSGTTPFDSDRLRTLGFDEIRRIIREEEPARPSARLSTLGAGAGTVAANRGSDPRRLGQLCRGELDWIVMKCLEKDRNRRYETASALAADVQHYLRDEPVQACPPSAWYRLRKYARQHTRAVTAMAAVLLVALLGGAGLVISNVLIAQERDRTEEALEAAEANLLLAREAVDKMYTQIARDFGDQPGMQPFQRELLRDALRFYREFARRKSTDPLIRLETAYASLRVAQIDYMLGERRQQEQTCRAIIAELPALADEIPTEPRVRLVRGGAHRLLAQALADAGRRSEAEQATRHAVAQFATLTADYPRESAYQRLLAATCSSLGTLLHDRPGEADKYHRDAIELCEALVAGAPHRSENHEVLATSLLSRAQGLVEPGEITAYARAETALRRAIDVAQKTRGPTGRPFYQSIGPAAEALLGHLLAARGQPDQAEAAYRRAFAVAQTRAHLFPDVPSYWSTLCAYSVDLIRFLETNGRAAEAAPIKREAIDQVAKLAADFPEGMGDSTTEKWTWVNALGLLQRDLRDLSAAEKSFRKALALAESWAAPDAAEPGARRRLAEAHRNLAVVLQRAKHPQEAVAEYRASLVYWDWLAVRFPRETEYSYRQANVHNSLGIAQRSQSGAAERAVQHHRVALTLCERLVADYPKQPRYRAELVRSHYALGSALAIAGRYPDAEQALDQALAYLVPDTDRIPLGQDRQEIRRASILNELAWLRATRSDVESRDVAGALALAREAVALDRAKGAYWNTLGVAHYRADQWKEAIAALNKSMSLSGGGNSFDWFFMAMAHQKLGEHDQAATWHRRAVEWMDKHLAGNAELRRFRAEAEQRIGAPAKKE